LNPFQKSPVIQIDNKINLTESVAIFRYLAREKSIADHWYPSDSLAQARVDEYLEWQHLSTRVNCAMYFQKRWMMPFLKQKMPDEKTVALMKERMERTLSDIEKIWLANGDKAFLCGDEISVADILAACEMEQPSMAGYDVGEGRPILAAYMQRVRDQLNPHYDNVHDSVYMIRKRFAGDIPGIYASR